MCVYQCEFLGCFVFLLFFFDGRDQTPGFLSFFFFLLSIRDGFHFQEMGLHNKNYVANILCFVFSILKGCGVVVVYYA